MTDLLSPGRRPAIAPLPMVPAVRSLAPVVPHLIAAVLGMLLTAVPALAADEAATDGYVGSARCGTCHAAELTAWRGSHHDLAMAEATPDNVLGDFDDAEFTAHGVTTRFYRDGDEFRVDTDGPDGKPKMWTLVPAQGIIAEHMKSLKEWPPRQLAESLSLQKAMEAVMQQLEKDPGQVW
jgi:hypothetical protein